MRAYSATDVGLRRKINQDSIFVSETPVGNLPNLFIVADGMGGHNGGDHASKLAVSSIRSSIEGSREKNPIKLIGEAVSAANTDILKEASEHAEMRGMGTTCVVATVIGDYVYTANVGDSRLYLFADEALTQITRDHSLVEEMVRLGELTQEEARNHPDKHIITRALGAGETVQADFFDFPLPPDGVILMCSDGLTNMVGDREIEAVLTEGENPEEQTATLIQRANDNGGKDNIAVIVIRADDNGVKEEC